MKFISGDRMRIIDIDGAFADYVLNDNYAHIISNDIEHRWASSISINNLNNIANQYTQYTFKKLNHFKSKLGKILYK